MTRAQQQQQLIFRIANAFMRLKACIDLEMDAQCQNRTAECINKYREGKRYGTLFVC